MALLLDDLIPVLKASLNPPGQEFYIATDDQWREALNAAFWWGRMRGFFVDYRADADRTEITNVVDPTEDMPMEVAQIIVAIAAVNSLEAKAFSLETKSVAEAGPVKVETQRAASVIVELLRIKRRELQDIREQLLASQYAVYACVIDAVLAREGAYMRGEAAWVR